MKPLKIRLRIDRGFGQIFSVTNSSEEVGISLRMAQDRLKRSLIRRRSIS